MAELRQTFRPEFLNRIDDIIVFRPLHEADIREVARRMLRTVSARMETMGIHLDASDEAVAELAKEGFDARYGARPLRRAIQSKVEDAVAEKKCWTAPSREATPPASPWRTTASASQSEHRSETGPEALPPAPTASRGSVHTVEGVAEEGLLHDPRVGAVPREGAAALILLPDDLLDPGVYQGAAGPSIGEQRHAAGHLHARGPRRRAFRRRLRCHHGPIRGRQTREAALLAGARKEHGSGVPPLKKRRRG